MSDLTAMSLLTEQSRRAALRALPAAALDLQHQLDPLDSAFAALATDPIHRHVGALFHLVEDHLDVSGGRWRWAGSWDVSGQPLLYPVTGGATSVLPWAEVYQRYGPLIPAPRPPTVAEMTAALLGGAS